MHACVGGAALSACPSPVCGGLHVASSTRLKDCPDLLYHIFGVFTIEYTVEELTEGKDGT